MQICNFSEKGQAKSRNQHIHVDPRFCFEFGEAMCVDKKIQETKKTLILFIAGSNLLNKSKKKIATFYDIYDEFLTK